MRDQPEHSIPVQLHHPLVLLRCRSCRLHPRVPQRYPPDSKVTLLGVLSEILPEGQPPGTPCACAVDTTRDGVPGENQRN